MNIKNGAKPQAQYIRETRDPTFNGYVASVLNIKNIDKRTIAYGAAVLTKW